MIAAIIPQEHDMEEQHPYILVHIETLDKFNTALVDSSSCYNVVSAELFHTLTNVELLLDNLPAHGITGHTKLFIAKVFLKLKIAQLICLDQFYVMPPQVMPPQGLMNLIILGTPWQRKHKAALD